MTKWMVGLACAAALTTSVMAESLYNAGELGVSLSSGYVVDPSQPFNDDYVFNLSGGAFWFPIRNLGVEANVPFYQTKGVSVDEVQAGLLFRVPLAKDVAVFKNFAPYLGLGAVYAWDAAEQWAYNAKVGVEFRTNKKWGVFVEGQYRNFEFKNWGNGETTLQGGLKLVL